MAKDIAPRSRPLTAVLSTLGSNRPLLVAAIVCSIISSLLTLSVPAATNTLLASLTDPGNGKLIAVVALLGGLAAVFGGVQRYLLSRLAEASVRNLRVAMSRRVLSLPIARYDAWSSGDIVSRLGNDTALIRRAVSGGLVDLVGSAIMLTGSVILMYRLDPILLLVLTVVLGIAVAVVIGASTRLGQLSKDVQKSLGALSSKLDDLLGAVRTIRGAGTEEYASRMLAQETDKTYRNGILLARASAVIDPITAFALQAALVLVVTLGGVRTASGMLSVADLVTFIMVMALFAVPLATLASSISSLRLASGAIERVTEVIDSPDEQAVLPIVSANSATAADYKPGTALIEFRDVTFSYAPVPPAQGGTPTASRAALRHASWSCQAGEKVAIVGASGSGKSTMLQLLMRFYDPDSGTILFGGRDIRTMGLDELRASFGYLEQEAPVIAGTVLDNFELFCGPVTENDVWRVLEAVNLAARFAAEGVFSAVGGRGVTLSGGEKQRLAAARLALMDSRVLLLDEPASALDSGNETVLQELFEDRAGDHTIILVAHRLSTAMRADRIIVVDAGSVIDVGTHAQLYERCATYRTFAQQQGL